MNIIDIITAVSLTLYGFFLIAGMFFDDKDGYPYTSPISMGILCAVLGITECVLRFR